MAVAGEEGESTEMSEELRVAGNVLEKSTQMLIRQFSKPENRYRLQEFRGEFKLNNQESELGNFTDTWKDLNKLVSYWLTTPQEEVQSNAILKEKLETDVKKLKDLAKTASDNYKKKSTECKQIQE